MRPFEFEPSQLLSSWIDFNLIFWVISCMHTVLPDPDVPNICTFACNYSLMLTCSYSSICKTFMMDIVAFDVMIFWGVACIDAMLPRFSFLCSDTCSDIFSSHFNLILSFDVITCIWLCFLLLSLTLWKLSNHYWEWIHNGRLFPCELYMYMYIFYLLFVVF